MSFWLFFEQYEIILKCAFLFAHQWLGRLTYDKACNDLWWKLFPKSKTTTPNHPTHSKVNPTYRTFSAKNQFVQCECICEISFFSLSFHALFKLLPLLDSRVSCQCDASKIFGDKKNEIWIRKTNEKLFLRYYEFFPVNYRYCQLFWICMPQNWCITSFMYFVCPKKVICCEIYNIPWFLS